MQLSTLSPGWPPPALFHEWCSAGMTDWQKSEAHLPSIDPGCFLGSSQRSMRSFITMLKFRLACVNLHLHNGNQSTETLLGTAILSAAAQRMLDQLWGSCALHVFGQSAHYPFFKFKQRAQMQFLWEFFWPLNLFCNHYWRIPGAT